MLYSRLLSWDRLSLKFVFRVKNKIFVGNKNLLNLFKFAPHDTKSTLQDKLKKYLKAQLSIFYSCGRND